MGARRRIIASAIAVVVVGAAVGTYLPLVLLTPMGPAAGTVEQPVVEVPGPVSLIAPYAGSSAVSVIGAEQFPGTVGADGILISGGSTEPRPIASVTKLITALVILEGNPLGAGEPGPTLTFSEADSDLYDEYYVIGATIQPMKAGSKMTLHDALEMMLVVSATNYADAISEWAFGSVRNFRAATQAWLDARGLGNTTIVEPTGVDSGNVSTPSDLISIGKIALENPVIAEIVSARSLDVPGFAPMANTNTLVGDHGVTGLKTGTSDEAGACLLFSARIGIYGIPPITVVGAVLGGNTRGDVSGEVVRLLDSITDGFHAVPAVARGDVFGTFTTPWGDEAEVVAAKGDTILTWSDMPITATVDIDRVTTADDGDIVGSVTFTGGEETVSVPLELKGSIGEPDAWWRITHPDEVFGG